MKSFPELDSESILVFERKFDRISISGKDRKSFLQGLITQDIELCRNPEKNRALFPKNNGKIVFDAYLVFEESKIDLMILKPYAEIASKYIEFFHINEDIEITYSSTDSKLYYCVTFGELKTPQSTSSLIYFAPKNGLSIHFENPFPEKAILFMSEETWEEVCPLFSWVEIKDNPDSFPAELGLENCVSYQKGCYVGQEPIARMEFKGKVQKSIYQLQTNAPVESGDIVLNKEQQKAGTVLKASPIKFKECYYLLALLKNRHLNSERPITFQINEQEAVLNK